MWPTQVAEPRGILLGWVTPPGRRIAHLHPLNAAEHCSGFHVFPLSQRLVNVHVCISIRIIFGCEFDYFALEGCLTVGKIWTAIEVRDTEVLALKTDQHIAEQYRVCLN